MNSPYYVSGESNDYVLILLTRNLQVDSFFVEGFVSLVPRDVRNAYSVSAVITCEIQPKCI
jgi:hypothetical protein